MVLKGCQRPHGAHDIGRLQSPEPCNTIQEMLFPYGPTIQEWYSPHGLGDFRIKNNLLKWLLHTSGFRWISHRNFQFGFLAPQKKRSRKQAYSDPRTVSGSCQKSGLSLFLPLPVGSYILLYPARNCYFQTHGAHLEY